MNIQVTQIFEGQYGPAKPCQVCLGQNHLNENLIYIAAGECSSSNNKISIVQITPYPVKTTDGTNNVIGNLIEVAYSIQPSTLTDNIVTYPHSIFKIKVLGDHKFIYKKVQQF